jgi:hypothetical protein
MISRSLLRLLQTLALVAGVGGVVGEARGQALPARPTEPARDRGTPQWLFFTTAGASVLTLTAGTTLVVDAATRDADEKVKSVDGRNPATRDAIRSQATTGSVLLGAGGLLGVTAAVLALTTRWSDAKRVTLATNGLGLFLGGEL